MFPVLFPFPRQCSYGQAVFYGIMLLFYHSVLPAQPFITTWKTDNPGTSEDHQILIPGTGENYSITWEAVDDPAINGSATGHDATLVSFPEAGIYKVYISQGGGTFSRINFNNTGDRLKLLTIGQWGDTHWSSMENALYGCANMTSDAEDAPDLSAVTILAGMFHGCASFNGMLDHWDVSGVTNMSSMFQSAIAFNQRIDTWDVSNVTNMRAMFREAVSFNRDISTWDVSQVTNMSAMFIEAHAFNQDIGLWSVANVTNMFAMFADASVFNQDISGWDVGNVTDMSAMFQNARAFNQHINTWNVGKVTNMSSMFQNAIAFDQDIGSWDVSQVVDMSLMFAFAVSFDRDIGGWDVSEVRSMFGMFSNALCFNGDISTWDVSKVTDMSAMFSGTAAFNQDISAWDVSGSKVMSLMFADAMMFDQNLGGWDISGVEDMTDMLSLSGMSTANYDRTLTGWAELNVKSDVSLGAEGLTYCHSLPARQVLTETYHWTISGDVEDCTAVGITDHREILPTVVLTPNPVYERTTFRSSGAVAIIEVCLWHISSAEMSYYSGAGQSEVVIDMSMYPTGIYLARVQTSSGFQTLRLIRI